MSAVKQDLEQALACVKGDRMLPRRPYPKVPYLARSMPIRTKLKKVQEFIEEFEYNHTGVNYFSVDKRKPMIGIVEVARDIIREALPIKCLEGVALAMFLTCGIDSSLVRVPLRFKSRVNGHSYWHIVMLTYHRTKNQFGAIGLSRLSTLGFKDLIYNSATDVINDYIKCYESVGHIVEVVTLGLPFGDSIYSSESIFWSFVRLPVRIVEWETLCIAVSRYLKLCMRMKTTVSSGGSPLLLSPHSVFDGKRMTVLDKVTFKKLAGNTKDWSTLIMLKLSQAIEDGRPKDQLQPEEPDSADSIVDLSKWEISAV